MMDADKPQCLIFDLEATPATEGQSARIFKLGALRPDTGQELELPIGGGQTLAAALARLDALAAGAAFVLGHNIIAHDLPLLRAAAPELALLQLPVIDTLRLSPLAFPQNPYHRLLKNYKLIRDSLNSPLADCRSTLTLFRDQHAAFTRLHETLPDELLCYQALLTSPTEPALTQFFTALTGQPPDLLTQVQKHISTLLAETDASLRTTRLPARWRRPRPTGISKASRWPN